MDVQSVTSTDMHRVMPAIEQAIAAREPVQRSVSSEVVPVGDKTEPEPVALSAEKAEIISRLLNEILKSLNWNIRIRVDKSTETIVTQIVDTEKNEIIKQIPPQELLEIMSRLKRLVGLLLDREA